MVVTAGQTFYRQDLLADLYNLEGQKFKQPLQLMNSDLNIETKNLREIQRRLAAISSTMGGKRQVQLTQALFTGGQVSPREYESQPQLLEIQRSRSNMSHAKHQHKLNPYHKKNFSQMHSSQFLQKNPELEPVTGPSFISPENRRQQRLLKNNQLLSNSMDLNTERVQIANQQIFLEAKQSSRAKQKNLRYERFRSGAASETRVAQMQSKRCNQHSALSSHQHSVTDTRASLPGLPLIKPAATGHTLQHTSLLSTSNHNKYTRIRDGGWG